MASNEVNNINKFIELSDIELEELEERLDSYDRNFTNYKIDGNIRIGIKKDNKLIAGAYACMTSFRIMYVCTVYVEEDYRNKGYGRALMNEIEVRAKEIGANMIRLDTFDWQGREFYKALNYEEVGYYRSDEDNFSESFFLKRI